MMKFLRYSGGSLLLIVCRVLAAEPLVSVHKLGVTYRGTVSHGVEHFQNIKYAHDTSDQRRFAPPEPFSPPINTVVDATSPGPSCPQITEAMLPFFSETESMSEDCLHLRISRPVGYKVESKLPVIVWLHGGGVVKGSAYDPHFDPTNLIKLSVSDKTPVIYAALNYRLSIFGFARSRSLKSQKSLNVGMRDQRLALEWIESNIEMFGGDPKLITVFGLSAGGTFLSMHPMVYGGVRGVPFQRAWMMSGPPGTALNMTSEVTELHTRAVAAKLGCENVKDPELIDCLRSIPMHELLKTALAYSRENHPPNGLFTFIPSVDDDFFPDQQSNLVRNGQFVKGIFMIFGWTQDDGAMNVGPGHLINDEEDMKKSIATFAHALTPDQISKLFSLYSADDFQQELHNYEASFGPDTPRVSVHYFRLSRILRDLLFTCSSIDFGYQMFRQTRADRSQDFNSIRLYDLNQSMLTSMWAGAGMPYIGVSHGSDTNYIFNGVFPEGDLTTADETLSKDLARNLISFAATGDPTITSVSYKQLEEWPTSFEENNLSLTTDSMPLKMNVQVIGGIHGTGTVSILNTAENKEHTINKQGDYDSILDFRGSDAAQSILDMGSMTTAKSQERNRQIRQEKLLHRCEYIMSLQKALGI